MILIALDLSTRTGIAIGETSGGPLCHTEVLGKPGESHGHRFSQALHMTKRLIEQHGPDVIAIEAPIVTGAKGGQERAQLALGLRACVMGICHIRGVRFVEYPVQTIRKHFIGQGNLKRTEAKAAVMKRCRQLGWHVDSTDEADAAAVWDLARAKLRYSATLPPGLFDARAR